MDVFREKHPFFSKEAEFLIKSHEYSLSVFGEECWNKKTSNLCDDDKSDAETMEDSNNEKKLQFGYDLAMNKDVMGDTLHSVVDFIRFPNKNFNWNCLRFCKFR